MAELLDYLKRAGRRSVPTEDVYFTSIPDQSPSLEKKVLENDLQKRLWDCCNQLAPPYRQVALDYYYYELDISEITEKTGKNKKTLQTQIYRAKGMLRKLIREEDLRHD